MNKKELRQSTIALLKSFSSNKKQEIEQRLKQHLLTSSLWKEAKTIGITVSQGIEWETREIIEAGWEQGKTIVVPKCIPASKHMIFYRIENFNQLEKSYYNLLEPKPEETVATKKNNIDLLIVPGLLYDQRGYRIGFGGGYYDRFLIDYPNVTVSLAHSSQVIEKLDPESFDVPVQYIITESGLMKCR